MRLVLLTVALICLPARVLVFQDGGTVGAWACTILFFGCLLALFGVSLRGSVATWREGDRRSLALWVLGVVAFASFAIGGFSDDEAVETATNVVLLISVLGLIAVSLAGRQPRNPA
jgi:hypothetical protein